MILGILLAVPDLRADVKLPAIFGDHIVLKQDGKIPVWGLAAPSESVTVEFAGQKKSTRADSVGKWPLDLVSIPATIATIVPSPATSAAQSKFPRW